jgi:hypothetical protein
MELIMRIAQRLTRAGGNVINSPVVRGVVSMRAEAQAMVDEIEESLKLLRRRL